MLQKKRSFATETGRPFKIHQAPPQFRACRIPVLPFHSTSDNPALCKLASERQAQKNGGSGQKTGFPETTCEAGSDAGQPSRALAFSLARVRRRSTPLPALAVPVSSCLPKSLRCTLHQIDFAHSSEICPQMTARSWSAGLWMAGPTPRSPHTLRCRVIYWRIGCGGCERICGGRQGRLEAEGSRGRSIQTLWSRPAAAHRCPTLRRPSCGQPSVPAEARQFRRIPRNRTTQESRKEVVWGGVRPRLQGGALPGEDTTGLRRRPLQSVLGVFSLGKVFGGPLSPLPGWASYLCAGATGVARAKGLSSCWPHQPVFQRFPAAWNLTEGLGRPNRHIRRCRCS